MAVSPESIFWEVHSNNPREGPGSDSSTRKAFALLNGQPADGKIIDIGCGPGAQTLCLASLSQASILAVDSHRPFIEELTARAELLGYQDRIRTLVGDMRDLPFGPDSFDCIWAEGSIYIIGVENGLRHWGHMLRNHGSIAFTEISWLKERVPSEATEFWTRNYPDMLDVKGNLVCIARCGYRMKGHFVLPQEDWWKEYYGPISRKLPGLIEKYANNAAALEILQGEELELEIHRKYSDAYSYVFYVAEKASEST
jgi:ubiquinone/menaquinone biosynthesis C-methylase UbiE